MKGDIKSLKDLQTYCQKAKMRHDFGEANDVSPFECATGQMPAPGRNKAMVPPERTQEGTRSMHVRCRGEIKQNNSAGNSESGTGGNNTVPQGRHALEQEGGNEAS